MRFSDTTNTIGAYIITTKSAAYASCHANGMVAVRVLSDPTGVQGSWIDRPPVTDDWRDTAQLMVSEWEGNLNRLMIFKDRNRNRVWVEALKVGTLILDYFIEGFWYCTVWNAKEVC